VGGVLHLAKHPRAVTVLHGKSRAQRAQVPVHTIRSLRTRDVCFIRLFIGGVRVIVPVVVVVVDGTHGAHGGPQCTRSC
jgi:hypothetical protein